jgi:Domain of Unknown Function (DUF326)
MNEKIESLKKQLYACADACGSCFDACLKESDVQMMVGCIRLDRDCADICLITASYLSRGSEFAHDILKKCADICDKCAAECAKHDRDHCKKCAEACKACADACRKA